MFCLVCVVNIVYVTWPSASFSHQLTTIYLFTYVLGQSVLFICILIDPTTAGAFLLFKIMQILLYSREEGRSTHLHYSTFQYFQFVV